MDPKVLPKSTNIFANAVPFIFGLSQASQLTGIFKGRDSSVDTPIRTCLETHCWEIDVERKLVGKRSSSGGVWTHHKGGMVFSTAVLQTLALTFIVTFNQQEFFVAFDQSDDYLLEIT